jgi:hypothetical protein
MTQQQRDTRNRLLVASYELLVVTLPIYTEGDTEIDPEALSRDIIAVLEYDELNSKGTE